MADLESLGLIEQPHTSAGRVPSDAGYRHYVESLMVPGGIHMEKLLPLLRFLDAGRDDYDHAGFVRLLSDCADYAAMMLLPPPTAMPIYLSQLALFPATRGRAFLVILSSEDDVLTKLIDLPIGMQEKEIYALESLLITHLQGLSVSQWRRQRLQPLFDEAGTHADFMMSLIETIGVMLTPAKSSRVYLEGVLNLLELPEFQDVGRVKEILRTLENPQAVEELLGVQGEDGVQVHIGDALPATFSECGLVTLGYTHNDKTTRLALLGPKRMQYAPTVALMKGLECAFALRYQKANHLATIGGSALIAWEGFHHG